MNVETCRDKKYYKSSEIAKKKLGIVEHIKNGGTFANLKKLKPDCWVAHDTIRKWRSTDPFFDQVLRDLTGKGESRFEQKRKVADSVLPTRQEEVITKLCAALQRGVSLKGACGYAAINKKQLDSLMDSSQEIHDRIVTAIHSFELLANQQLQKHYEKDWKSIAWHLERRLPHEYGEVKNIRVEQVKADDSVTVATMTQEEQARLDEINRKILEIESGE